ncbi:DUF1731 domain-containing protein [Hazenella coriacea]|uniref:Uncharacterized protein DUF1731 n=1 Tax=Hazenella coriacea TaxID=1179467 RepID=A0A4R3LCG5_9BACL|nr:DUF1731 domain-containing protein [Hazenella coriacea]TCS96965.1 uncharacterized protein DUF1731 [Hazenella coriacea]
MIGSNDYGVRKRHFRGRVVTAKVGEVVLHHPTFLPIPGFLLRSIFGETAETLLIGGAKVMPTRLIEAGYSFTDPDLLTVLTKILANKN